MANKSSSELMLAAIDVLEDCELMGSAKILVSSFELNISVNLLGYFLL